MSVTRLFRREFSEPRFIGLDGHATIYNYCTSVESKHASEFAVNLHRSYSWEILQVGSTLSRTLTFVQIFLIFSAAFGSFWLKCTKFCVKFAWIPSVICLEIVILAST